MDKDDNNAVWLIVMDAARGNRLMTSVASESRKKPKGVPAFEVCCQSQVAVAACKASVGDAV
jgi:hypothetical protein